VTTTRQKEASQRWAVAGTGAWYDQERWANRRRRERDPRVVRRVLARLEGRQASVLDAPCGTGRLCRTIGKEHRYTGVDSSPSMLEQALPKTSGALLTANVNQMPFASDSFDAVICCRLLHHLRTRAELETTLAELLRVSRGLVAGSFWDARSLAALAKRLPWARRPAHRAPFPKAWIRSSVEAAGGRVIGWEHSARFFSQQAWFVAEKR